MQISTTFGILKFTQKHRNRNRNRKTLWLTFYRNSLFTFCCYWSCFLDCLFIDCPNCVDESQYMPNKWTMPLLKLGEKRYYLGIFFKVSRIPWAIGHLQKLHKTATAICDATDLTPARWRFNGLSAPSIAHTYCIWYFTSKAFKRIKAWGKLMKL